MMKRRRLADLYVRGKYLDVDDGSGEPARVWLQKLNEVDRDTVVRRANAGKARFLIEADDEESETFAAMYASVRDYEDRKGLVAIAVGEDLQKYRARFEAELALDEERWGKDGYLQSLVEAWVGTDEAPGLAAAQAEDPDDPEAKRVHEELERFEAEVADAARVELTRLEAQWEYADDDSLWRSATRALLKSKANEIFMAEFDRQQLFHVVREPDQHAERYFRSLTEVDDLDEAIRKQLADAYNALQVSTMEGKSSGASPDSSSSSEASAATSEPSGPSDASA